MLEYFLDEMVPAVLKTYGEGEYDSSGRWTPGTSTTSDISIITPQPVAMNDLKNLEDGEHPSSYVRTWCEPKLRVRENEDDSDEVEVLGETYKVVQVDDRKVAGRFYRAVMRRL
jgi:hypothetical protein